MTIRFFRLHVLLPAMALLLGAVSPAPAQSLLSELFGGSRYEEARPRPPAAVNNRQRAETRERARTAAREAEVEHRGFLGIFGGPRDAVIRGESTAYGPVPWEYRRQQVGYRSGERPGTIIVDTRNKFLYLVTGPDSAIRYGVGVGREGFGWRGTVQVGRKAEWPGWTPPPQMIARERRRGRVLPAYMPGGPANPLGARALYLHRGGRDTLFRIHGTNEPWTIGRNVSSGCIRMVNADVIDLYSRVRVGAKVIVR